MYETLWFRLAGLTFGSSVWASSTVLASFMAGLALGNGLVGRLGGRIRYLERFYAALEIAIGAGGLCLVFVLGGLTALLAPLRVVWLPGLVDGERTARPSDLLKLGDPRDPGRLRQLWVLARHRDRCRIVAGDPAPAAELRQRWRAAGGSDSGHTAGQIVGPEQESCFEGPKAQEAQGALAPSLGRAT